MAATFFAVKGSFNNYVDQILPNFAPLSPLEWTIVDILHDTYTLSRDHAWTFYWPPPPFSCPRSYWMTPKCKIAYLKKPLERRVFFRFDDKRQSKIMNVFLLGSQKRPLAVEKVTYTLYYGNIGCGVSRLGDTNLHRFLAKSEYVARFKGYFYIFRNVIILRWQKIWPIFTKKNTFL